MNSLPKFTLTLLMSVYSFCVLAGNTPAPVVVNTVPSDAQQVNRVVAVVNNGVITQQQLDAEVAVTKAQIVQGGLPMPDTLTLQRQVLHRMIVKKAMLELAALKGITVSDAQVDAQIQAIAEHNNITTVQLKQALAMQGVDYQSYWTNMQQQIIVGKLEQEGVVNNIQVTPVEIDNYLAAKAKLASPNTQYHVQHILLPLPNNPTAENLAAAKQHAQDIVNQINNNLAFTKAAMQYSQSDDALEGGDLGWKTADQLPTIFSDPVQTMAMGSVYGPIQTDTGFHIIKLVDKRSADNQAHYVAQTHVLDILVKTSPIITDAKAQSILTDLRAEIEKGADFGKLAQANSQDLATARSGGDMGWVNNDQLDPELVAQMKNLSLNEVSQPFKTKNGWYLIKVTGRRQQDNTQDYIRLQAQQSIFGKKAQVAVENWQGIIVGDSYIKILVPELASAMNQSPSEPGE